MQLQRSPSIAQVENSAEPIFLSDIANFWPGRALLCSTALAALLAMLAPVTPAQAQTVTTDGDVITTPPVSLVPAGVQTTPWSIGNLLIVGESSTGSLDIEDGGVVSSANGGIVGNAATARGVVTVSGLGSVWNTGTAVPSLIVGNFGGGDLNILHQGKVNSDGAVVLGNFEGSSGTIVVNHGGEMTGTGPLIVGQLGAGSLTVWNGAVSSFRGAIGNDAGSGGAVTVTGLISTWTNTDVLVVGGSGSGVLNIENGGRVSNTHSAIGGTPGAVGIVSVSGPGSRWTNNGNVDVGYEGSGTLGVRDGGVVSSFNAYVGTAAGSTGMVTVEDAGSRWSSADLFIGYDGDGALSVLNGGLVISQSSSVGSQLGSIGAALVNGGDSRWSTNDLTIGGAGTGRLDITDGGEVISGIGHIGFSGGANGEVTVDGTGSTWGDINSTNDLYVGVGGNGALSITGGGTVFNSSGFLGSVSGGRGNVTVNGNGSLWNNTAGLYVGQGGAGNLAIENGGRVGNSFAYIGHDIDSTGTVLVDGSGSTWISLNDLSVGEFGTGSLNINAGGTVANWQGYIGNGTDSIGIASVDGAGSTWTNIGELYVGNAGTGSLIVSDGGNVSNTNAAIGAGNAASGEVLVTGSGSAWTNDGLLVVGGQGSGMLTIADGGHVAADNVSIGLNGGQGRINIGDDPVTSIAAAPGTLDTSAIDFAVPNATLAFNHTGVDYTFTPELRSSLVGDGVVDHFSGTTILTANSNTFTGTTNVRGGTLRVDGTLGGSGSTAMVSAGGILGGGGTIGGHVTVGSGGTLAPGSSIGTLNVADATFDASSTYAVELNDGGFVASTNNDLLNASGGVTINGGTLHVTPENGTDDGTTYSPGTYTVITAAGGVTGTFDAVTDDFAFLAFTDGYDASNVFLTSSMDVPSFCLAGYTANQCTTGEGVFSIGSGQLYTAVLNLSTAEAHVALDQLSGEIHASAQTALIDDSRFARETAIDRLRVALEGIAADPNGMSERRIHDGFAFWGQGFGSWGRSELAVLETPLRPGDAEAIRRGADGRGDGDLNLFAADALKWFIRSRIVVERSGSAIGREVVGPEPVVFHDHRIHG
ncbi:transporter [Aquamicrobium defluvii]|uniref:Transporter n=1 Tax=Aquamicrobium defluvii TaxID=69279 RepID=A0A011U2B4_9HYPH|nr:transporter [Aquamicrobium defluvii]